MLLFLHKLNFSNFWNFHGYFSSLVVNPWTLFRLFIYIKLCLVIASGYVFHHRNIPQCTLWIAESMWSFMCCLAALLPWKINSIKTCTISLWNVLGKSFIVRMEIKEISFFSKYSTLLCSTLSRIIYKRMKQWKSSRGCALSRKLCCTPQSSWKLLFPLFAIKQEWRDSAIKIDEELFSSWRRLVLALRAFEFTIKGRDKWCLM